MFPATSKLPSEALYAIEVKRVNRHAIGYIGIDHQGLFDSNREAMESCHEGFVGSMDAAVKKAQTVMQADTDNIEYLRVVRLSRWAPFPTLSVLLYLEPRRK